MLNYAHCELCPRRCGVDRTAGQLGFCRMPDELFAAKAMLHYWEEPVISAAYGAGTVFFSGCFGLRCVLCGRLRGVLLRGDRFRGHGVLPA